MKVLYGEGLVSHTGLESCVVPRKGAIEALTEDVWAELLSREKTIFQGADVLPGSEGNNERSANDKLRPYPARSIGAGHVHKLSARKPGDPDTGRVMMLIRSA